MSKAIMKRYAIADEVPEDCDYLTAGKEYEILQVYDHLYSPTSGNVFIVGNDKEALTHCVEKECTHLNGKSWRIVERE